jgi:hypothetical protein
VIGVEAFRHVAPVGYLAYSIVASPSKKAKPVEEEGSLSTTTGAIQVAVLLGVDLFQFLVRDPAFLPG